MRSFFTGIKATRCRNRSLKWRKRSTSAAMNWRSRLVRGHRSLVVVAADSAVGADAPPQIVCTLSSGDVYSA